MSRTWSEKSKKVYDTLDPRLQVLVTRIRDEVTDISLFSGYRDRIEQNTLFENSRSTLRYPDSKHNRKPCKAVDLQPYPYPEYEPKLWGALGYIAGHAMKIAAEEGIEIRWGGDWNRNGDLTDQNFDDLFHLEIVE